MIAIDKHQGLALHFTVSAYRFSRSPCAHSLEPIPQEVILETRYTPPVKGF